MKNTITSGYDTEAVRQLASIASGEEVDTQYVYNLARTGHPLSAAQIRPGFFSKTPTMRVIKSIQSRRLLARLGRISPRLPGTEHDTTCRTCKGDAVTWEGSWLCVNGHGGNTNENK